MESTNVFMESYHMLEAEITRAMRTYFYLRERHSSSGMRIGKFLYSTICALEANLSRLEESDETRRLELRLLEMREDLDVIAGRDLKFHSLVDYQN